MTVSAVVLAAGKGTRMQSDVPKPLHRICGRPLLSWVVHALEDLDLRDIAVVVGHGRDLVVESLAADFDREFRFAEQLAQRGTGDAAAVGLAELDVADGGLGEDDHVLVLPGDTPLLTSETVNALVASHIQSEAAATVVTSIVEDPAGYGRILRTDTGGVHSIVEHRDATDEQRSISEINGGMYCFRRSLLAPALRLISNDNDQGELYLTDALGVLVEAGHPVAPFPIDEIEIAGVNDRAQLTEAGVQLGARIAEFHMRRGVTLHQPSSTIIDAAVCIEPDVTIHGSTVLEGDTTIAAGAQIGPHSHLVDATVGEGAIVRASTVVGVAIEANGVVGPYQHVGSFADPPGPTWTGR